MSNVRIVACTAAAVMAVSLAACSSSDDTESRPAGALAAGTAEITIDGAQVNNTHDVKCTSGGTVTTITTGDDKEGTTSSVDTADEPSVQFAEFRDIGGFTGSYWDHLGPRAEFQAAGNTFLIKGTASGFMNDNPSFRVSRQFSIKVAC